ncbi:DUF4446 family protein [Nocardioides sp. BP30]|uniref:DUF4446 family protein n=1 Tax=Nocardioides sp. BP30 TaxID=3036374 RepID=UPI002468A7D4|nr:DUF4446 family protein [Nocardioides sp. BP30]WGL52654.1 DUF4446 family protein [Nocardioides sp. BP30]
MLAVLSLVVALLALVLVALLWRERIEQRARATSAGAPLPEDVLGLRQEVAALRAEGAQALRHLAIVRYDAFGDMGGHLSWSLALADDAGDGVLLTSIHGRNDARSYAKTIGAWRCDVQLSPEEEQALAQLRR